MDTSFFIAQFIEKKIQGSISVDEQNKLSAWIAESVENENLYNNIMQGNKLHEKLNILNEINKTRVWKNINKEIGKTRKIPVNKYFRYAAAIVLPLAITVATFYYFNKNSENLVTEKINDVSQKRKNEKAVLILSDGNKVELNKQVNNKIIDNGIEIIDTNRMLDYRQNQIDIKRNVVLFNTLKIPRGNNYSLVLADGSQVWLNAETELKYPVSFNDTVRQVFVTGEAFFQVAKSSKPFIVTSNKQNVRVLGTKFNVKAYNNDSFIKTTLVEGLVQIEKGNEKRKLIPSEQATLNLPSNSIQITKVETSLHTAWLNGKFIFKNEPLPQVMKQLARWYNFEYKINNQKLQKYHYTGRLSKDIPLTNLLTLLEQTTDLKIKNENNSITIE